MDERGLGKRLQKARVDAGLTQQQLCARANLSFSTLTKIERGAIKAPSIFTVQAIGAALGVGLDELVGNSAQSSPARTYKKTNSGASFIYFDVNGCLVSFYQRAFSEIARDTGTSPDVVETAFWQFNDDACRGVMTLDEFNAQLAKRLHVDSIDWQKYYLDNVEPITEMHEVLKEAAKHYKVGLLSNIMPGFLTEMRRMGLLPDIEYDAIIDSSEVASVKPEQHIFDVATERAGVNPSEILLIDDSRPNLMTAGRLGWNVLWFDEVHVENSLERVEASLEPAA